MPLSRVEEALLPLCFHPFIILGELDMPHEFRTKTSRRTGKRSVHPVDIRDQPVAEAFLDIRRKAASRFEAIGRARRIRLAKAAGAIARPRTEDKGSLVEEVIGYWRVHGSPGVLMRAMDRSDELHDRIVGAAEEFVDTYRGRPFAVVKEALLKHGASAADLADRELE